MKEIATYMSESPKFREVPLPPSNSFYRGSLVLQISPFIPSLTLTAFSVRSNISGLIDEGESLGIGSGEEGVSRKPREPESVGRSLGMTLELGSRREEFKEC